METEKNVLIFKLLDEVYNLSQKIYKLSEFMNLHLKEIETDHFILLTDQLNAMKEYESILNARIDLLESEKEV